MSVNSNFSDLVSKAVLAVKARVAEFKSNSAGLSNTRESSDSEISGEDSVEDNQRTIGKQIVLSSQLRFQTTELKSADNKLKGCSFQLGMAPQSRQRQAKKQRRKEREMNKGWFNMPATQITKEIEQDLMAISMRGTLDPKRFYKGCDRRAPPKYFQMGTVVEDKVDFFRRIPKQQRKSKTLVDQLLADVEVRRYYKRKCEELFKSKVTASKKLKKK